MLSYGGLALLNCRHFARTENPNIRIIRGNNAQRYPAAQLNYEWRIQLIDATLACSLSAGVSYPKVFLGR